MKHKTAHPFSIIVTCYNFEKYIVDCLESLVHQQYDPNHFEIICVDDGSTDGSTAVIKNYKERFSNFSMIRIQNSGLEKACNAGIRAARFGWVVRVDSDDRLNLDYLSVMNDAMHRDDGFDFYYCKKYFEYFSENEKFLKEIPFFDKEEIFSRGDFFATGTAYQKKDLQAIGLFPEAQKNCGLENYTVILSLLSSGKIGLAVADALFYYRRHHANMSTLKRQAIIQYGKKLLARYGREFLTNENHPYGLTLEQIKEGIR